MKPRVRDSTNKKKNSRTKAKNRKVKFNRTNVFLKRKKTADNLNKKIKNARKQVFAGITFKSKLEVYAYKRLLEEDLDVTYEEVTYPILAPFEYRGEKIRGARITPDFVDRDGKFIIETKGWETDVFKLRWKMFKKYLQENNLDIKLYLPKNQEEVDACIEDIKSNK